MNDPYSADDFHQHLKAHLAGPPVDFGPEAIQRRAAFAAEAVSTYGRRTGVADESIFLVIQDLMTDLRHLLDVAWPAETDGYPKDFYDLVNKSHGHYIYEKQEAAQCPA